MIVATAALAAWLRSRGRLEIDTAEAIASGLKKVRDEIAKANAARDSVRGDSGRRPDGLRHDDGFERGD